MLLIFGLLHRLNLDWQAKQIDEAGGIRLIINLILVEGSNLLIVQGIRGSNARIDDISLVKLQLNIAGYGLLSGIHKSRKGFP